MTLKSVPTSGRSKVTSSIVITMNLELNYVPKEETFPIPLEYIDVTWFTHTDLDVMQEKKIDDYWNVDSCKPLSDSSRGCTKFILLKEKPPKGYMLLGERLTKIPMTTRTDYVWPEVWTKIGKAAQNRKKQEWAKEKTEARQYAKTERNLFYWSRGQRILRNSLKMQENWKDLWLPRCRVKDSQASRKRMQRRRLAMKRSSKQCMVVWWNLTSPRGSEQNLCSPKHMKIALLEKGFTFMKHYNLVSKFIPMPHPMKIPDAKAAVDKEWKKLETIPAWDLKKMSKGNRSLFWKHTETKRKSTLPHWWTYATSKMQS